ncbi:MAG: pilus assembly protein [Bacteriovoracaceae bacterium]|nr:pilus assembly protein [Bacteriovoracaceae bacterium]
MKNKSQLKNETGQSTVEFIVVFVLMFGFMFVYLKIALNYARGYMTHYATYQAARAYLVFDRNGTSDTSMDSTAEARAKEVFKRYMSHNQGDPSFNAPPSDLTSRRLYVGAIMRYQEKFSFGFPFAGLAPMDMISEAFLGREPTRQTCLERTCKAIKDLGAPNCQGDTPHFTLDDNGC